jgi:peptidoglycan/xylan/chitin deacetylase (PgdA/CDA1 family)
LAYHGVRGVNAPREGERTLHLDEMQFERQLMLLREVADVVSLPELLSSEGTSDRLIAITFDDAYASAVSNGVSRCVAIGMPCTIFVAPALLGLVPRWDILANQGDWTSDRRSDFLRVEACGDTALGVPPCPETENLRLATATELQRVVLNSELVTIGNHSFTHRNLGVLSREAAHNDLSDAARWLRNFAGPQYIPVVAYPFGIPPKDPKIMAEIESEEVFGLLVSGGWIRRGMALQKTSVPRWNVPADISINGFRARTLGRLMASS